MCSYFFKLRKAFGGGVGAGGSRISYIFLQRGVGKSGRVLHNIFKIIFSKYKFYH